MIADNLHLLRQQAGQPNQLQRVLTSPGVTMTEQLHQSFTGEMLRIYERARDEAGYRAVRFLSMVQQHGGVETAKRLLPAMSDGFTELWKRNRLDLTVEALVVEPRWSSLFSASQVQLAESRLRECGYARPQVAAAVQEGQHTRRPQQSGHDERTSTYYLKVPFGIRSWYPGVAPVNWRETIFEDVTERGTTLVLEQLPANEEGDRIALHGDLFYVQVGRDRERYDALYVIRIEPAENNLPRSTPNRVACRIELWPGGEPTYKDPVGTLFGSSATPLHQAEEDEPIPEQVHPRPLLLSLLPQASAGIRQRFRPGNQPAESPRADGFLADLNQVWKRRRLEQFMLPTARQESLLKGIVTPSNLGRKERDGLIALFGFGALNKAALQHRYDPERFFLILDDFGRVNLHPVVRATLWTSMLEGLSSQLLREELFAAVEGLKRLASDGVPAEKAWEEGLLRALREVATRQGDGALREIAEKAEASEDPAACVAQWAANLGFERVTETVADTPVTELPSIIAPALVPSRTSSSPPDVWAFRTAGPEPATIEGLRSRFVGLLSDRTFLASQIADSTELLSLIDVLQQIRDLLPQWMSELPSIDVLANHRSTAVSAYAALQGILGDVPSDLLESLTPQDAVGLIDLMGKQDLLRQLPSWLWSADEATAELEAAALSLNDLATRLSDPERRRRVASVIAMVEQLGEANALKWLDPPGPGQNPQDHIAVWFERTRELLASAPGEVMRWLSTGSVSLAGLTAIERTVSALEQLRSELAPQVVTLVEEHLTSLESETEYRSWVEAYLTATDAYREDYGNPAEATFQGIRRKAEKERKTGQSQGRNELEPTVTVDHNWTESTATRATLVLHQPDPALDYGVLAAPIVLETREPRQMDVKLSIEVKGDHRTAWPKEWPDVAPANPIAVPAYGWQPQPDTDRWQYPLTLRVPVRKPRGDARLEVTVQVTDAHRGAVLGPLASLRWDSIALAMPPLELRWAGTTNPEYVRSHPIGPQAQVADIVGRFCAGGSVAVIAPRRFGKSTLVEYLLKDGEANGLLVPPAVVCTEYATAAGLDYERLWADVSDWCYRHLSASLPPGQIGVLPAANAFDQIRKAAKQRGFKAVVLLFDEAQLFFPHRDGAAIGTRLKNVLERHWSRPDDPQMVPLLVGLIGLPMLRERAGADLMGLVASIERVVITEAELRRLITGMTSGLQTTRAARARLAEVAGNLFILRVLLDRLVLRLRADSRVWANSDDLLSVERELKAELLAGREEDVARYIRDALNRADKITDWDPVPAFGVAAALAEIIGEGRVQVAGVSRVVDRLNEWCRLNATDENVRAQYDATTVEPHLAQLRDRRVIGELQFSSGLLEAWLQGVARHGAYPGFQAALMRGAQRRIELPAGAELVARGGQAEIWRSAAQEGKGQIAFRVRQLATPAEELDFQRSIEMFEVLRAGVLRREPGSDSLADIIDIGRSATDPMKALLVYRWIDGQDLASRAGELPLDSVVALGCQLSRAVALIHSHSILHRDIRPANIILDQTLMRPVLIDFGFARRAGAEMHTKLAGDLCAPEVRRDHPVWTKAADIYALAATLKALLASGEIPGAFQALLGAAMSDSSENRPAAEAFLDSLEAIQRDRQIERKRQDAWLEVRAAIDRDQHKAWFSAVVNKFRPHFEAMALGFYPQPIQRYRQIADFLNQSLEAYPNAGLTLKRLASDRQFDSLSALVVVRNADAHAGVALGREAREGLQKFQTAGSVKQKELMLSGIQAVADQLRLTSLTGLLGRFV